MKKGIYVSILAVVCFAACSTAENVEEQPKNQAAQSANAAAEPKRADAAIKAETAKPEIANLANDKDVFDEVKVTKSDCASVDAGDYAVLAAQTFPLDFAPFANSCFVTSYNPEFDDPPMETEFAVYKNGAKVFDFPDRFNNVEFGCTVEAVAFEDLNGDDLKDAVVVGKCLGKSSAFYENAVYVNTGRAFATDANANARLAELRRTKEITDFVRRNQQTFLK